MDLDLYNSRKVGINDLHVRHENGKYVIFYNQPTYEAVAYTDIVITRHTQVDVGDVLEDELENNEIYNDCQVIMKWLTGSGKHITNAEFMINHGMKFSNLKWSYTEHHNKILYTIKSNSNVLFEALVCYKAGELRSSFITEWLDRPFDESDFDLRLKISLLLINQAVETFPVNVVTTASHTNQEKPFGETLEEITEKFLEHGSK